MENEELVSVVIPCYNHQNYVQEALNSVISQTYKNIELIIIDDGSKDNSVQKIKELEKKCTERFSRFEFRARPNKGLCETLNEGFSWCEGDYICVLASDDAYLPHKIETQVQYLAECDKNIVGIFGSINFVDENGKITQIHHIKPQKYDFKSIFLHKHDLPATTSMLRADAIKNIGELPQHLIIEDWYMWLKLTEKGCLLKGIDDVFTNYRRHSNNLSSNNEQGIARMNKGRLQVVDCFKDNDLYNEARSNILLLVNVNDRLSSISFKEYLSLFWDVIKLSPRILFTKSFFVSLCVMIKYKVLRNQIK